MLSLYLRAESQRWAAQQRRSQHHHSYPASPSVSSSSSSLADDNNSVFSASTGRSRRSSISSVASEDLMAPAQPAQPLDYSGAPIPVYASLDQAVQRGAQAVEAHGTPRRLVTPGKLYENEEDDDEIVEVGDGDCNDTAAHQHTAFTVAAAG
ncbi:hypothetical protein F4779DRAFT_620996 [Xylariaceae sp. FL0662B]|nr:hypothetical protein F4779DRAFT_620996 [Xylariaceae sp. FL0662B]